MAHDPLVPRFTVGQVAVSALNMKGLAGAVARYLAGDAAAPGTFVVFRDAHGIVRAEHDEALRAAHEAALLVCPDGRPLVWIGRLRGASDIGQVPGIEAVETLCRAGIEAGWKHYFLGGGAGVAARLADEMQLRAPGLVVVGSETPPFRSLQAEEVEAMRARIRASGAQIVWVGLGTPKQELFMAEHAPFLPGAVMMGVGAAFDVNIGRIPRAPRLMQVCGLEWAYRLVREPRRLMGRYATTVPRFIGIALRT